MSMLGNVANSLTHLDFYGIRNSRQPQTLANILIYRIFKFEAIYTLVYLLNVLLKAVIALNLTHRSYYSEDVKDLM